MQRLAYKFGVHWEKQMMLGNGVQSPMGLFTPSAQGIPTSRDVNTYNTQTGPTFDGLKAAKYSLREMYMNKASWIFHRTIMEYISILKDGNGRYLLQDSTEEGEPDMLLGRPVRLSEYAPNTNTTGQYVGIFGDFSYVWTAIAYDMEVVPLFETSFKTNQVEYVARQSLDARPVMPEAFARITNT
jgi:HK97 family phage major capsid protein